MNNKIKIITGVIILIIVLSCGCGYYNDYGYEYMGINSEILLTPITIEESNNSTLRALLIDKLATNFSYVTIEDKNIYILYNEKKYVISNNYHNYSEIQDWQYSKINIIYNNSIMITSRVLRTYGFTGEFSDTKEIAERKAKDLIIEDKIFLKSKISIIIENIKSIYKTEIMYEKYDLEYNM